MGDVPRRGRGKKGAPASPGRRPAPGGADADTKMPRKGKGRPKQDRPDCGDAATDDIARRDDAREVLFYAWDRVLEAPDLRPEDALKQGREHVRRKSGPERASLGREICRRLILHNMQRLATGDLRGNEPYKSIAEWEAEAEVDAKAADVREKRRRLCRLAHSRLLFLQDEEEDIKCMLLPAHDECRERQASQNEARA